MKNIQEELNYGHPFMESMRNFSVIFADIQLDTKNDKQILLCPTFTWNSMLHFCMRNFWCTWMFLSHSLIIVRAKLREKQTHAHTSTHKV